MEAEQCPEAGLVCRSVLGKTQRKDLTAQRERVPEVLETSPNSPTWGGSREPQCTLGHQLMDVKAIPRILRKWKGKFM